jgi:hypothetical protein
MDGGFGRYSWISANWWVLVGGLDAGLVDVDLPQFPQTIDVTCAKAR